MTWARPPARSKAYGGENPSSPRAPRPVISLPHRASPLRAVEPKTSDRKSQSIRDSARGEDCTVRIVGACNFDPATTVWSHAPMLAAGRGMGMKALDLNGCFACACCHDVVDGRRPLPPGASSTSVLIDWFNGHMRSLVRLRQKGLI